MDKNSILGFLLIGLLVVGYMFYLQPSDEQLKEMKHKRDSVLAAQNAVQDTASGNAGFAPGPDSLVGAGSSTVPVSDSGLVAINSLNASELEKKYGIFAGSAKGESENFILENEKIRISFSSHGGRIVSAELKGYQTFDSLPLFLFDEATSAFNINFFEKHRSVNTADLYFVPQSKSVSVQGEDSATISFRLYADSKGSGAKQDSSARDSNPAETLPSSGSYIEFLYGLKGNSYTVDLKINIVGLNDIVKANSTGLGLQWSITAPSKEKNIEVERMASTVYFKYADDEVDYIAERKSEKIPLIGKVNWVSFKQQYFSAAIISEKGFDKTNSEVESRTLDSSAHYTKLLAASLTVPVENSESPVLPMTFFFGPNHYQTLKSYDCDLQKQIDLGWTIFGWVNEYLIIPIFNFLEKFNLNYGIIIFILTIIIKIIILPLTYKNFVSSAKMRVLKPEIDEHNERHKNDDPMKKQQAMMALYKKAGVNPLAGCVPMLLQMPILYAMFKFFPSSIELRQESFLWAEDLSTYDSIYDLGFNIPFYGDHISLFTLLMSISTFLYTKYNMQTTTMGGGMQAQQMKIMMYIMPFMLLGFFNSFSAGLSYYYFLANMISVLQQLVIMKWFIDEKKIHAQIQENKAKPASQTKSKFQQRLEEMAKKKGYKLPK